MKRNFITLLAICSTSLAPIAASTAWADEIPDPLPDFASAATLDAMQDQCDALAASYDTGNGDIWTGAVVVGAITRVSGPTEVADTREIDESTIVGTGTYVPSSTEIRFGDKNGPFRIGGSVNMFGDQWSTAGYYPDSTYTYTADFDSVFSHSFSCEISQEIYHPERPPIDHPVEGYYLNWDFGHGQGNDNGTGGPTSEYPQGACAAYNGQDPHPPFWGEDKEQCKFIVTKDAWTEEFPEYWEDPVVRYTIDGTPVEQSQTDTLTAFEDHGGRVNVTGEYKIGQAVVCISPSTTTKKGVPGAWRPQNGYDGGNMLELAPAVAGCNTAWFKVAQWGSGTTTSNGTYISVPFYSY